MQGEKQVPYHFQFNYKLEYRLKSGLSVLHLLQKEYSQMLYGGKTFFTDFDFHVNV